MIDQHISKTVKRVSTSAKGLHVRTDSSGTKLRIKKDTPEQIVLNGRSTHSLYLLLKKHYEALPEAGQYVLVKKSELDRLR